MQLRIHRIWVQPVYLAISKKWNTYSFGTVPVADKNHLSDLLEEAVHCAESYPISSSRWWASRQGARTLRRTAGFVRWKERESRNK